MLLTVSRKSRVTVVALLLSRVALLHYFLTLSCTRFKRVSNMALSDISDNQLLDSLSQSDTESELEPIEDTQDPLFIQNEERLSGNEADVEANEYSTYYLPAPPQQSFPTLRALKEAVHQWTKEYGYDLVVTSTKKQGRRKEVRCHRATATRNTRKHTSSSRVRKTSTSKS